MKAAYIDFDGTLTRDRFWRSLPPEQHQAVQTLLFGADRSMVHDWMRGKYIAEEINEFVSNQLGIPYDRLWQTFEDDCKTMLINPELLDKISQLRPRYKTVLMTVNMDSFTRFTSPALQLDRYFDHISNSFYEGKFKTDDEGSLFTEWSEKLEIPLNASMLIDDSPGCYTVFKDLGGIPIQTDGPEHTLEIVRSL